MRALLAMLLLAGCGRSELYRAGFTSDEPAPDAAVDAGVDAGGDAGFDAGVRPVTCASAPAQFAMKTPCSLVVNVLGITPSMPTCFVDVAAHAGDVGILVWDCEGDGGRAEIRFDGGTFVGLSVPPNVNVCIGTEFPWSDGCQWRSAQRMEGLAQMGSTLEYTYTERPDEKSGCAPPCTAAGGVEVE